MKENNAHNLNHTYIDQGVINAVSLKDKAPFFQKRVLAERIGTSIVPEAKKQKIIAIGGPKGGVGKSVFAINFAVSLASKGYKTVVVDLDLGGANVHLYLGKNTPSSRSINTFLKKGVNSLDRVMIKSDYGVSFIGGSNSGLGAAQIEYGTKIRLIKALGKIDADYVVLDLGGDMSYNCLDFFLSADYGIVVTTADAASYMTAYHFVKEAMYRKLGRLFGPESKYRNERDEELGKYLARATSSRGDAEMGSMVDLMEEIKRRFPDKCDFVKKAVSDFTPCLLLNKVPKYNNVHYIPAMVQEVTRKWLSKELLFLGSISREREVEESVREQIPVLVRNPQGQFALEMEYIVGRFFNCSNNLQFS